MENSESFERFRVCVIGAGAAGLCAVRHLSREINFTTAVFEQSNDVGGTWIYDEKTGIDENDYPIHSSMYKNLRTNLAVKIMNFPDYQKLGEKSDASCGSRADVLNYLRDYTEHYQLRQFIQFNTRVECVRPVINEEDWKKTKWIVQVKNTKTNITEEREFDAVMACNGHYFEPNIPRIPGIESFSGQIMHSHDYRKPDVFVDKIVIILGAASSGIDIGFEICSKASHVYLSHNRERLIGPLPSNMTQISGVESIQDSEFLLRDGKIVNADCFVYCTGYKYSFPFFDETCSIRIDDNYISPLYKHLVNIEHPTMSLIGIPLTVIPFPLFDMQVQYHIAILTGRSTLPTKATMLEDSKCKTAKKRHAHLLANQQFAYNDDLAISGSFEKLPAFYENGYVAWNASKVGNLLHYKDSKFLIMPDKVNVQIIPQDSQVTV